MRLLDLFSGAGGAAMGYHLAGFTDITGVDIQPQPRYPFRFIQGDALDYVAGHGHEYDFIHASPPCQGYSGMRFASRLKSKTYPLLIEPIRSLMEQSGAAWVIENVMGSKLDASWLCGEMFGLPFYRHRYFKSNFLWLAPSHPPHVFTVRNGSGGKKSNSRDIVHGHLWSDKRSAPVSVVREVLGVEWMTRDEITQCVPPIYTQYVGTQWLNQYGRCHGNRLN